MTDLSNDRRFPWFRLYSEITRDRKIDMISREAQIPKCIVIGAFVMMMCFANESPERGVLLITNDIAYTPHDLMLELGLDSPTFVKINATLVRYGMIAWIDDRCIICNWKKRQAKSDDSYKRVTKYRERQRQAVTPPLQNCYSNTQELRTKNIDQTNDEEESVIPTLQVWSPGTTADQSPASIPGFAVTNKPNIFKLHEQNIGIVTPILADALIDAENKYPWKWLEDAYRIAVEQNARSWAYIDAILKRWQAQGNQDDNRKNGKAITSTGRISKAEKLEERNHAALIESRKQRGVST